MLFLQDARGQQQAKVARHEDRRGIAVTKRFELSHGSVKLPVNLLEAQFAVHPEGGFKVLRRKLCARVNFEALFPVR